MLSCRGKMGFFGLVDGVKGCSWVALVASSWVIVDSLAENKAHAISRLLTPCSSNPSMRIRGPHKNFDLWQHLPVVYSGSRTVSVVKNGTRKDQKSVT